MQNLSLAILSALIYFSAAHAGELNMSELQKPPTPIPADMPKLSPLLADADGKPISTQAEWLKRRDELKRQWQEFLGPFPQDRGPLDAKISDTEDLPEFTRYHVTYRIEDGILTDGYVLTPKNVPAGTLLPAMVVFHPTVKTHAKEPSGVEDVSPDRIERQHGLQLVKRGYLVLCPRCYLFDDGADVKGNTAKVLEKHPEWKGMARMTYDGLRAADYLCSLRNVDKNRIGCMGHSLGAKETLYAAAFDERYKVAVFSEGGIGISFSNWEANWYLGPKVKAPGFALDHHQVMAFIAPRSFLILAGESADNDKSWAYIDAVLPVYKLFNAPEQLGWLDHRKGHTYPPNAEAAAESVIDRALKTAK